MSEESKHNEENMDELISEMKKGKAEAFRILYKKYHQKVYRFALRMLGDPELAQDAYQETFIKIYEHRKEFRGQNFTAWLYTIARHTCLNIIRSRKNHDSFDEVFHGSMHTINTDFTLKEHLEEAISMVPIALREALILREYEQYTYQEIADQLDIDLSLAKIRVHRARVLLRKLLKPLVKEINES